MTSGFSLSTLSSFISIENKIGVYIGKDCMKKFCECFREQSYQNVKICYICKKKFEKKYVTKLKYHCYYTGEYRGATRSIFNLEYSVPKKFPIVFYNGS